MKKIRQIESHATYDIWEVVLTSGDATQPPLSTAMSFSKDGACIGDRKDGRFWASQGVTPEKATPESKGASIGWQENGQKWWGWSHRAKYGFGIGSTVTKGDMLAGSGMQPHDKGDKGYRVGYVAKTLEDAKKMAICFAGRVS